MRTSSKKTAHVDLLNLTTWQHILNILHLRNHLSVLSVCVLNRVQHFATPWTVARQAPRPWNSPGKNTGVRTYFLH